MGGVLDDTRLHVAGEEGFRLGFALSLRSSLGMKKFFAIAVLAGSGEHGSQETFLSPLPPPAFP